MQDGSGRAGRVTIRQVAARSGVSVSAVSKVLRNAYGVSASLRDRVLASITELDYRPLASARAMRGRTYTLGLVLPDIRNPLFAEILNGLTAALKDTPYNCILGVVEAASDEASLIESMIDRQVDGLIMVGPVQDEPQLRRIADRLPLVAVGFHGQDLETFDTVNGDDVEGGKAATLHLVANGFRNITMLSLDDGSSSIIARRELGYRHAMIESGLGQQLNIIRSPNRPHDIQVAADGLLLSSPAPFAVFCWCDLVALEFIGRAVARRLALPVDLGVVGYDNSAFSGLGQNSLTSVDQAGEELGAQAGRLLVTRIDGRVAAQHVLIHPKVIERESTRSSGGLHTRRMT